jgi:hypothetical protein
MLVGAISDKVDPVMMNRAIVNGILSDLRSDKRRPDALAALSLVRLLDMYATDRFEENQHIGILEQGKFQDFNASDNSRAYKLLQAGIDSMREKLGYTRTELVERLEPLLAHFAKENEEAGIDLPADDVAELERFLATLSETLTEPR